MHVDRKLLAIIVSAALGCAAVACATVADLDVTRQPPGPREDLDDAAAGEASADAPTPTSDSGTDAPVDSLAPPAACSCTSEQACCVPKSGGPGMCTAPTAAGTCMGGDGLFIRCAGSDVANGRVCCFSSDGRATYYAASCEGDAGVQVCTDDTECSKDMCHPIPCRGAMIGVCAPAGTMPPVCPQ